MSINFKFLVTIITGFLVLDKNVVFAKCYFDNCEILEKKYKENKKNQLFIAYKKENDFTLEKILEKNLFKLDQMLGSVLSSSKQEKKINSEKFIFEIESDTQYFEKDLFFAKGNVRVILPNGIFKADKISYDKVNKFFKAIGNLNFENGDQFFKADYLEYDFLNNKGYIDNIFGILDFSTIDKDLKISNSLIENESCPNTQLDLNELPTEIELLGSSNERYKNFIGLNKIKFNFSTIKNWRFKSERIDLRKNQWKTNSIDFTNDPYNHPQLIVRSEDFKGEIIDNETIISSNSTTLNFDNKFTIPVIGRRSIGSKENSNLRWGIGYETNDKDGFYLIRNFDPIIFNKNLSLDLQPYFLLQRSIQGETNAFRKSGSNVLSDNVKRNSNFYDSLALKAKFKGSINSWKLNVDADTKTLNPDYFYDSFSSEINLLRNLYSLDKVENTRLDNCINEPISAKKVEDYSIDFGIYSIFDKDDIYMSYGTKLINTYKSIKGNTNKYYSIVLDYGEYQGRSLSNNYELKDLTRYGLSSSLTHKYKIFGLDKETEVFSGEYNNSSKIIDKGVFINAKVGYGLFEYSNGKSQSLLSFMAGPSYAFGNFKRNFFDYTSVSVFPEFVLKNGESPFKFDDFNNDSRIRFNIKQQIYGPLLFGLQSNYNINTNSSNYGKFENKIISLELSRRAYSLSLSYLEDDNSVFFGFEIFNFGNHNFEEQF